MFRLPKLKEIATRREMISEFGGYNHNPRIASNEFYDMENMSSDLYPLLSPRKQRKLVRTLQFYFNGLAGHNDKLAWVDGTDFYYNGKVRGQVEDSAKQLVSMGAYLLIWPDKKYFSSETYEFGDLENTTSITDYTVSVIITPCKLDGTEYEYDYTSDTAPEDPQDGDYWYDTSGDTPVLKQFSAAYGMWNAIATTYVKIQATGIGVGFAQYDAVTISGIDIFTSLNGEHVLYGAGDDYIIIIGIIYGQLVTADTLSVRRKVPDMDYITALNNRVWGCSSRNHEIYASVLGDPKNWNRYLGISTDSYTATVGSDGDFTGCIGYLGSVLFFKEDMILKVYGNRPANFQITETICRGVQKGSESSLVIVNETLYYKSRFDVCAYNGNLPVSISGPLGDEEYWSAAAGALGDKLYMSLFHQSNGRQQFVFDITRGLWYREALDSPNAVQLLEAIAYAATGLELYMYDGLYLWSVDGGGDEYEKEGVKAKMEGRFPWFAQTGDIGLESPDNKYVTKLQLRMEVDKNALVRIEVQYDQEDVWVEKYRINPTKKRSVTVPIIPRRCDTMRIRISGRGDARIYSLAKTIEQGSEM